jgi:spermidine/putrescine transport system substrate-binding protein
MSDDGMKILVPPATLQRVVAGISRRRFLEVGLGGVAAAAILAACGGDNSGSSSGASTSAGAAASGGGNSGANKFNLFTWAEYDDPDLMKKFGDITIDVYNSNEDAIAKLEAGGGTSGYDMVVPTGVYIPQMVSKNLLEEIDVSRIPNFTNLDQAYTNQPWDPGNKHSVCKDWGTTGWIYDNSVITTPINSWQDFLDAAKSEGVAGKVSIIDSPADVTGLYFWAKGIDWNTTNPADLDAAEQYLTKELAPHLKALDSYPGINLTQGNYVLSQVFNGDARQGLLKVEEAGGDPKKYTYSIGQPKSELWMDNWCIVKGAKNVDAAYNFMNFILDPDNSATDTLYHGYNPGVKGVEEKVADMKYKEIVFLTAAEVSTLTGQKLDAQERQVDIYNKVKAAAGS